MALPEIPITDLTTSDIEGTGVFDILMRANKAHLESEFQKNRIKGTEYATVYLGSLESVMQAALQFLLQRQEVALKAQLMEQQVLVAQAEVQKANAQVELARAEVEKTLIEKEILLLSKDKVPAEIAHINAQTELTEKQTDKVQAEMEILVLSKDKIPAEINHIIAQTDLVGQQRTNLTAEALNIPKQGAVLDAQKCKLDAEFDLTKSTDIKVKAETNLLNQKTTTEKAQTMATGVDEDSVVGKQKKLYQAQTDGFQRDAEQKAAKLMVDSWNVRRTTDEGTVADGTNMLADSVVGRAVTKMLNGVGA